MINFRIIIAFVLMFLAAFGIGRYTTKPKVVEKEKIVYQDKIVEKKVLVSNSEQKSTKVTVKMVTILPDGTKKIETKIFDTNDIEISQKIDEVKAEESKISKATEISSRQNDWLIGASIKSGMQYGIFANRRIIGPFYLGAFAYMDNTYGANLGCSF